MENLESEIINVAKKAVKEAVIKSMTGYSSPFDKYVKQTIENHEDEFKKIINDEVVNLLNAKDFRIAIKDALHNKLARTLVHKVGGEYEKMVNRLKQDAVTRSKITIAIDNVINEMVKE